MQTETTTPNETLTVDAAGAARLVGVSRTSWYSLLAAGRAPEGLRLGGRRVWGREELAAWVAAGAPPAVRWRTMWRRGR